VGRPGLLFLLTSISEWNRSKPPNAASAQLVGGAAQLATVGWLLSCTVAAKESERMDEELQGRPAGRKPGTFRLGDTVRIVSGPFVSFTGKIEGINQNRALLKVRVAIYGRNKPIKLNFSDVESVSAPRVF